MEDRRLLSGTPGWAFTIGGAETVFEESDSIAVGAAGDIYVSGQFGGTADFDPSPEGVRELTAFDDNIYSDEGMDQFVAKYSPDGELLWVHQLGGYGYEDVCRIALDGDDNVYFVLDYSSSAAHLDGFPMNDQSGQLVDAGTQYSTFFGKFDAAGEFQWVQQLRAEPDPYMGVSGINISVHDPGPSTGSPTVYIVGHFHGTVDFDPSLLSINALSSNGGARDYDAFVAKYNADGDYVWAQRAGNPLTGSTLMRDVAGAVAVDADGNAYVCGYFHGTADFGGTITLTAKGDVWDAFVAKLNASDGTFAWARRMGGDVDRGQDRANAVTVSAAGTVYVGGTFYGTADFGPDAFTSQGSGDAFLSKLDNEGMFLWTKQFGSGDQLGDSLTALSLDDSGDVYAAGPFSGSVDFDPTLGAAILTANRDSQNTFVAKLDSNGTFLSARRMGGQGSFLNNPRGIQAFADAIYTTGPFGGVGDFDTGTETVVQTSSGTDIFVVKTTQDRGAVFGRLFNDQDRDGVFDANEMALQGWTVYLDQNQNGTLDAGEISTTTGPAGDYVFQHLLADTPYYVAEIWHPGWLPVASPVTVVLGDREFRTDVDLANATTILLSDSFENGQWNGLWVEDGQNDWSTSTQRATDGSYSAEAVGSATDATLTVATPIDLTDYGSAELSFDWFIEYELDAGEYVALDLFNGTSWQEVATLRRDVDVEGVWHHESVTIDGDYFVENFQLRFRATMSESDEAVNIDDVVVVGIPVDATAPTADIVDVTPDPRTTAVSSVTIVFSEPVAGLDLADLALTRDGGSNLLTASQTLSTDDHIAWVLGGLSSLTSVAGSYQLQLTATGSGVADLAGNSLTDDASDSWTVNSLVALRQVFYNHSSFDTGGAGANADDDAAIAVDKQMLLPGGTASFANYTSYDKGINGLMIDVLNLGHTPTADDFLFRIGNDDTPYGQDLNNPADDWPWAPAPLSITLRAGAGLDGADRVTLIWDDGVIRNCWLQVTMLATDTTALAENDVFYVGNAVGESGNSATDTLVNATDEIGARNNPHGPFAPATVDDHYDFNRDKLVNATDQIIARNHRTSPFTALKLIQPPVEPGAGAGAGEGEAGGDAWGPASGDRSVPLDDPRSAYGELADDSHPLLVSSTTTAPVASLDGESRGLPWLSIRDDSAHRLHGPFMPTGRDGERVEPASRQLEATCVWLAGTVGQPSQVSRPDESDQRVDVTRRIRWVSESDADDEPAAHALALAELLEEWEQF